MSRHNLISGAQPVPVGLSISTVGGETDCTQDVCTVVVLLQCHATMLPKNVVSNEV